MSGKPLIFAVIDAPADWLGLNLTEKAILVCLVSHLNSKRNGTEVWPSIDRLALLSGGSRSSIKRALRKFEDLGFIKTRTDSGRSNVYSVHVEVIHSYANPVHCGPGISTNPVHGEPGTRFMVNQGGFTVNPEQPKNSQQGTTEDLSPFGCSTNLKLRDGNHQRKLAVHGMIAGAVKSVSKPDQEQPTIDKSKLGAA